MSDKRIKWSNEALSREARKYKTRGDFQKFSKGAYLAALRRGILDKSCSHMPARIDTSGKNNPAFKWSLKKIQKEALNYKTRKEFFLKNGSAYNAAIREGVLDRVCS